MQKREEDEFFSSIEKMSKLIEELMRERLDEMKEEEKQKPLVYGLSMKLSNGHAMTHRFGNLKEDGSVSSEREPLVDIIEGKEKIIAIFELPGVKKKEDIDLQVSEARITIKVPDEKHYAGYAKTIGLPDNCIPSTAKAKYNNGILEVTIKRKK